MKDKEKTQKLIDELKALADNDFERHRIAVLEKDLTEPPKVEVIDDTHQKFNGFDYFSNHDGHYIRTTPLHKVVYNYYKGEIPTGYIIHHIDWDKENNDISNLIAITQSEHNKIHHNPLNIITHKTKKKACIVCGKTFWTLNNNRQFCSHSCALKSSHEEKREKAKDETRICKRCGKIFPKNDSVNGCFCSAACQGYYHYHHKKTTTSYDASSQILLFDVSPSDSPNVPND